MKKEKIVSLSNIECDICKKSIVKGFYLNCSLGSLSITFCSTNCLLKFKSSVRDLDKYITIKQL